MTAASVLLIERPGGFRDAVKAQAEARGAQVHVRDDALEALASARELAPEVVLVSDDPGPPGALSVCRILQRMHERAVVYRLGGPGQRDALSCTSPWVSRTLGPDAVAAAILGGEAQALTGVEQELLPGQLPQLLLRLADRAVTGLLLLDNEQVERTIVLLRGIPVFARSSVLKERLGAVAVAQGLISRLQREQALDLCRAEDLRFGEALVALKAIDGAGLFRLLATQVRVQLEHACAASYRARLVESEGLADDFDLMRVHPMAAVLGALQSAGRATLAGAFERLSRRPLARGHAGPSLIAFLHGVGCEKPDALVHECKTLAGLKQAIGEQLGSQGEGTESVDPSALALSLLAVRAVAWADRPERPSLRPVAMQTGLELLRLLEDLPELEGAGPPAAVSTPSSTWEHQLDAYIFARLDRSSALHGAAAEVTSENAALYALYAQVKSQRDPWSVLGVDSEAQAAAVRRAYHARLAQVDEHAQALPSDALGCRTVELRRVFDRARDALLGLAERAEADASLAPVGTSRAPTSTRTPASHPVPASAPPPAAALRVPSSLRPPPDPAPTSQDLTELEPLLQQGDWQQIARVIEKRAEQQALPAHVALVYAVALKETEGLDTSSEKPRPVAEPIGIRAMAELLRVPEESAAALVVAKRMLRRRPLEWNRPPERKLSIVLAIVALVLGAGAGLLFSQPLVDLFFR